MRMTRVLAAVSALAIFFAAVSPVYGHAFGQRYDLPIPLSYFLIGAAATVALSFVVIGMFVQKGRESFSYPRLNLLRVPVVGAILSSGVAAIVVRALSVALFLLLLLTGFIENQPAHRQPLAHVHLDNLVGWNGLHSRAAGQRLDVRESMEDNLRVVPENQRAVRMGRR